MRILFCNYEYPPLGGGGGVVNALLAEELARRHETTVLTSRAFDLLPDEIVNGVRVVRVPVFFRRQRAAANFPSMLAYLAMARSTGRQLLSRQRYDVINTHFALPSGPVGDALSRHGGIPNVLSVHGGDLYDPSKRSSPHRHGLLRLWIRRLLRRADQVVGQSRNTLENVRRYYAPEIDGVRIPLGIKRPPAGEASRARLDFQPNDTLLITVGRLVARKAVDQLLASLQALGSPSVHLLIVGTGPAQADLERQAASTGLGGQVHFLGNVTDSEKFELLRMADIFVSTSQHEGFGLVFLEAMACGLPVVCYDHGGQTDFLEDGRTGCLVPLDDRKRFISGCRELIGDATRRSVISATNQRIVEDFFIDRCAERYEEVFERVVA